MEATLIIIKPDAVRQKFVGKIIDHFECHDLNIVDIKMKKIEKEEAELFYSEHRNKPFFKELVSFISSGESVLMIIRGNNAIQESRSIIGNTDFKNAKPDTIRRCFASSITSNAVHGSDSTLSAEREISFFFPEYALVMH